MIDELHAQAGQLIVAGFPDLTLSDGLRHALTAGRVSGAILFSGNLTTSPAHVADLNSSVYAAATEGDHPQPFVCVDQEGGRVQRLREPLTRVPPMFDIGTVGDPELAVRTGQMIGDELAALGFNLDFAPVADIWTNPENQVIGDRAFGSDAETVSRMAGALALGLTMSGVIPCAKHFPGHGDTFLDSHEELPVVQHDIERLRRIERRFGKRRRYPFGLVMQLVQHVRSRAGHRRPWRGIR